MDRRKEAGAESRSGKEENRVYLSKVTHWGHIFLLQPFRYEFMGIFAWYIGLVNLTLEIKSNNMYIKLNTHLTSSGYII